MTKEEEKLKFWDLRDRVNRSHGWVKLLDTASWTIHYIHHRHALRLKRKGVIFNVAKEGDSPTYLPVAQAEYLEAHPEKLEALLKKLG
jgi:hypothetical protein